MHGSKIESELSRLERVDIEAESLDALLERVGRLAVTLVDACDTCAIALGEHATITTVHATDRRADQLDHVQYVELHQGPGVDAWRTGRPVRADALQGDERWPSIAPAAAAEDIVAAYSVPMTTDRRPLGCLNLYSGRRPFSPEDVRTGGALADAAAAPLSNAREFDRLRHAIEHLGKALESRDTIGQAVGVIRERHDVDAAAAFEGLRAYSQRHNMKVRDVAERLLGGQIEVELSSDD